MSNHIKLDNIVDKNLIYQLFEDYKKCQILLMFLILEKEVFKDSNISWVNIDGENKNIDDFFNPYSHITIYDIKNIAKSNKKWVDNLFYYKIIKNIQLNDIENLSDNYEIDLIKKIRLYDSETYFSLNTFLYILNIHFPNWTIISLKNTLTELLEVPCLKSNISHRIIRKIADPNLSSRKRDEMYCLTNEFLSVLLQIIPDPFNAFKYERDITKLRNLVNFNQLNAYINLLGAQKIKLNNKQIMKFIKLANEYNKKDYVEFIIRNLEENKYGFKPSDEIKSSNIFKEWKHCANQLLEVLYLLDTIKNEIIELENAIKKRSKNRQKLAVLKDLSENNNLWNDVNDKIYLLNSYAERINTLLLECKTKDFQEIGYKYVRMYKEG
ncbi:MAG: hypothetical protein ACTSPY_04150 [Candidatus Helarchaeota archaeon]